ncbi:MAG: 3'-5' exonuclease [Candidatus Neomarinimicrobiota bacterium]|nr:3'-5' exonuclease [Candidatus Neomarinimicrobiota bacterium]
MSFIKSIKKNSEKISLYKLNDKVLKKSFHEVDLFTECLKVCFLDLETTGTDKLNDKIIEIGIKLLKIDKKNGQIISIDSTYESFNDPNMALSEKITKITGISSQMVKNQRIDWNIVQSIVEKSDILVAHNASFDRAFLDRYLAISNNKIWACSINDVDWIERGFVKQGLEILCFWHGFYYDSHRALNDVDAMIHLLCHQSYKNNNPLFELIKNSKRPHYKIIARDSAFELKDLLRSNRYWWDGNNKYWWKRVDYYEIEKEKQWLNEYIYSDYFKGIVEEIPITEKYK